LSFAAVHEGACCKWELSNRSRVLIPAKRERVGTRAVHKCY